MKKRYKLLLVILLVGMIIAYGGYFFIMEGNTVVKTYSAKQGYLSLEQWDENESIIRLNGEWNYYPETLFHNIENNNNSKVVSIPENKKRETKSDFFRYGTYILDVDGLNPNQTYGIYSGSQVTAFNLYANEVRVLSNGVVSDTKEEHISEWKPKSGSVVSDSNGHIQLAIEISNYEYPDGIFWSSIQLGNTDAVFASHMSKILVDILLMSSFIIIPVFLLSAYVYMKLDKSVLYFGIFMLDIGVRLMVTSSRPIMHAFGGIPWNILVRIEYLTGYMLLPILFLFVLYLVEYKQVKRVEKAVLLVMVLLVLFVGLSPHGIYTKLLNGYLWVVAFALIFNISFIIRYYRRNTFVMAIFVLVFTNYFIALGNQLFGSMISYIPVALFNAMIGMTVIILEKFLKELRQKEILAFNAMIDPLTGLYNRHYFEEYNKDGFKQNMSDDLYVLFLDLDGFKVVNDTHGHKEGDYVLQIIGQRLRHNIRTTDTVIRYGGDEFVVIASATDYDEIVDICQRIIDSIRTKIVGEKSQYRIGISIGVTKCDISKNADLREYVKISDEAMYQAKSNGGNRCVYI